MQTPWLYSEFSHKFIRQTILQARKRVPAAECYAGLLSVLPDHPRITRSKRSKRPLSVLSLPLHRCHLSPYNFPNTSKQVRSQSHMTGDKRPTTKTMDKQFPWKTQQPHKKSSPSHVPLDPQSTAQSTTLTTSSLPEHGVACR